MQVNSFQEIEDLIKFIKLESKSRFDPVHVIAHPKSWRCIGVGNSAAVFQPRNSKLSVKVFADEFSTKAKEESEIYQQLGDSPFFSRCYRRGDNFLILEYRKGQTVYDCLLQGLFIPEQVIHDVDCAIQYAKSRDLNPSDIHVKNILVDDGRGFLIDVSSYRRQGHCKRWDTLKQVYFDYYLKIYKPGMAVPSWLLETIRKWYRINQNEGNIKSFADSIIKMFF